MDTQVLSASAGASLLMVGVSDNIYLSLIFGLVVGIWVYYDLMKLKRKTKLPDKGENNE